MTVADLGSVDDTLPEWDILVCHESGEQWILKAYHEPAAEEAAAALCETTGADVFVYHRGKLIHEFFA